MVVNDKFVFIEMPRTGSTHTQQLLRQLFSCDRYRMHSPADEQLLAERRVFIGTIRNPWDWYVSHWEMFRGGVGEISDQVTRKRSVVKRGPSKGKVFDPSDWSRAIYRDNPPDVRAFRHWIRLLCTPELTRVAFPAGYGQSDLHRYAGFYTFSYARLFCTQHRLLHTPGAVPALADLNTFVEKYNYITHMVRTENLATDLKSVLLSIGIELNDEQIRVIDDRPATNYGKFKLATEAYYDDDTLQLIAERDRFIIERYGHTYPPPARDELGRQTSAAPRHYKKGWRKPIIA
jgi:hypothetical protein